MKPANNLSVGGCFSSAIKLTVMILVIIATCVVLFGCKTSEPCGTYSKWESKTPFRSK